MTRTFVAALLVLCTVVTATPVSAEGVPAAREVSFVLTAYYSPLPGQCCYVMGGLAADKILNGNGTHGADGTPVYVGMLAAPPSYAFGTRVRLPGLGVLEVHDRGGAIQELDGGSVHRLDVWTGYGEEGLARALSFGVRRMKGVVYPPRSGAPAADFSLDRITMNYERLRPYSIVQNGLIDVAPREGDRNLSVAFLQDHLRALGYVGSGSSALLFGPEVRAALESYQRDRGLPVQGTALDAETAAMLMADVRLLGRDMGVPFVNERASQRDIATAQRLLRSLGYYKGRTDGRYTGAVRRGVIAFQQEKRLIADASSVGAGRIGPLTQAALSDAVRADRRLRLAHSILVVKRVRDALAERGRLIAATTKEGYHGDNVKAVQRFLATLGFFPAEKVNGVYGRQTRQSVAAFQMAMGVVSTPSEQGAGIVGPLTLKALQQEQVAHATQIVRSQGWDAL